ncbi:hypothetical protein ACM39_17450 [Chryseobacterium sp. FH2]|uniref:DUF4270 family protein n=1 Tax=Chryseobacterium sp. FH2 TaxID=1674291 RepID=UPI00065AFDED|nr:DUF4270 family protein [Chryseobacterium sp. FH2]KMQ62901.1 hypothetical protein ACM39_17450 [Chryseobacterium sp. FH2]
MTYSIKRTFVIFFLAIFGSVLLYNCEPDPDSLGEQLFQDGAAQGNEESFPLIAYNIDNLDTIQSDASRLNSAVLGAFKEGKFGMQKASYLTQLRLSTYDPDFGANAVVDSVVLVIKPTYATDSVTTTTNEDYMHPDPAGNIAAKKVVDTYPVNKYGNAKKSMTIKVNEVTDFLDGYADKASSGKAYAYGQEIGSKTFDGNVNLVTITKDSDASSIYTSSAVGTRIKLDSTFFQNKIIAKKGQPELKDVSNFIRYFRGLRISVAEDDGYLMQFDPNGLELTMYYKYDKTENGTTTKTANTYTFALGSGNTHIGNYVYNRPATYTAAIAASNKDTGDKLLYTQGMGGASIGVKFPKETIDKLKVLYQKDKAAIISAKIRIYTDSEWTSKYYKPTVFTITQRDIVDGKEKFTFTNDLLNISSSNNFSIYKAYDLDKNPTHYDFTVTQSLKDIVEGGEEYKDKFFKIDMGSFLLNSSGTLAGQQYTSRAYARDRAVFVGTDPNNENNIQLKVIYGTK